MIIIWLGGFKRLVLLYKASEDGFSGEIFHRKCDHKGATVTVVTSSEGYIFGGYAAVPWNSNNGPIPDTSASSFLFSQGSPHNNNNNGNYTFARSNSLGRSDLKKFALKPGQEGHALFGYPSFGPVFGCGFDLCCCDDSNEPQQGHSYGYSYDSFSIGGNAFLAREVMVYQVLEERVSEVEM